MYNVGSERDQWGMFMAITSMENAVAFRAFRELILRVESEQLSIANVYLYFTATFNFIHNNNSNNFIINDEQRAGNTRRIHPYDLQLIPSLSSSVFRLREQFKFIATK